MDCAKYYHDNGDEANATVYRQYADYYAPGAPGALNAATAAPPPPPAHAEYRKQQDGHEGKENGHDVPVAPSQAAKKTAPPPSAPQKSLGIISGYGSDDDDE